ncbi:MAG: gluconate 2-dehydrogenase subunit 3 family protein, partial [Myxococcota bacterium]|nr:gluconate 2-dehydrogenase subunit 3 family protein [Myxococcota bacterium]
MATTRRTLIKGGFGAAALLAAGGLGLGLRPGAAPPPAAAQLKALTPQQYGVLVAVAARMCPGGNGRPSASDIGVAAKVDAQLATMHPADAAEFGQGLLLVENALVGLLLDGRGTPFTLLGPREQDEALEAFRTSRIPIRRSVYKALRGLVAASYWGDPRLYEAV